jgi:cell division transport system permease protein
MGRTVASQVKMTAFISQSVSQGREARLERTILGMPGVRAVAFTSRVRALQALRQEFRGQASLEAALTGPNPLLDALTVEVRSPADGRAVYRRVAHLSGIQTVVYPGRTVSELSAAFSAARSAGLALALLLAISSFLLISNAIRLAMLGRRREIEIMLLVGAGQGTVRGPFLLEGAIMGALGGMFAAVIVIFGYEAASLSLARLLPFLPLIPVASLTPRIIEDLLASGGGLGLFGALFALRSLVRVQARD